MTITLEIDDKEVRAVLARLAKRATNARPALLEIGEALRESTLRRFAASAAPDGGRWAPNRPSTLARWKGGAKRGAFGVSRRGGPLPWGDIPARPFLGLSADDRKTIEEIVRAHLLA